MLWFWILGTIVLIILMLCLLRIRVQVELDGQITAQLRIGPVRIQLYPSVKKEKAQPAEKASQADKPKKDPWKSIPKPNREDIKDAFRTFKPVLLKALHRTRRGIRFHPLTLSVILGGREDPAQTAEYYGYAHAALWTVMPILEQLLVIPDPAIHIGMDFDSDTIQVHGSVGVSIRIGTLLVLAFGVVIPAAAWFLKYLKRKKADNKTTQQPPQTSAA